MAEDKRVKMLAVEIGKRIHEANDGHERGTFLLGRIIGYMVAYPEDVFWDEIERILGMEKMASNKQSDA